MNKEYLAGVIALLMLFSVQITTIWIIETDWGVRLFLAGLAMMMILALLFLARGVWRRYHKLIAEVRANREHYSAIHALTEQNDALTKQISELSQARESLIRQQTKLFDLLQEKNK